MRPFAAGRRWPKAADPRHLRAQPALSRAMRVDFAMAAQTVRIGRPPDVGCQALMIAVARRAARDFPRLRRCMMHGRVVTFDAACIERLAMCFTLCKQTSHAERIRPQRLKALVASQAVVIP